jgi:hypothetical protein
VSEQYEFNPNDRDLLRAAEALLKKVAAADTTKPAELVSIAKLQHVLSVLPRVTSGVEVSVSVSCPPAQVWRHRDDALVGGRGRR